MPECIRVFFKFICKHFGSVLPETGGNRNIFSGDDIRTRTCRVAQQDISDLNRGDSVDLTDRFHDILYFTFGDIGGSLNGNDRQDAAGNQRWRSYDTGWIGDLPTTVSSAAGTGITGDGYNLAVFKRNSKRAAQRAADAD